ncbi:MAG TPA: hypothetical protein VFG89_00945 [Coriobacteriia bacterium]|nr:hypothetical protein [Coriobacteriia bacterium]
MDDEFVGESGEAAEQPSLDEVPQVEVSEPAPKPLSELVPEVVAPEAPEEAAVEDIAEAGFDARVAEIAASLDTASFEPVEATQPDVTADAVAPDAPAAEEDAVEPEVETAGSAEDADIAESAETEADADSVTASETDDTAADAADDADAPAPDAAADAAPAAVVVVPDPKGAAWWPFIVLAVLWVAFAGALGWLMYSAPSGVPSVEVTYYQYTIIAGVALTLLGPLLAIVLFFNGRDTVEPRSGFFATLLLRASLVTLAGVVVWWIVLIGADAYRLGRLL